MMCRSQMASYGLLLIVMLPAPSQAFQSLLDSLLVQQSGGPETLSPEEKDLLNDASNPLDAYMAAVDTTTQAPIPAVMTHQNIGSKMSDLNKKVVELVKKVNA